MSITYSGTAVPERLSSSTTLCSRRVLYRIHNLRNLGFGNGWTDGSTLATSISNNQHTHTLAHTPAERGSITNIFFSPSSSHEHKLPFWDQHRTTQVGLGFPRLPALSPPPGNPTRSSLNNWNLIHTPVIPEISLKRCCWSNYF